MKPYVFCVAVAVTGCAEPVEHHRPGWDAVVLGPVAPPVYQLGLDVPALMPGQLTSITATGALPGDQVWLAQGDPGSSCPPPLGGLCIDLANPTPLTYSYADGMGSATLFLPIPGGTPVGSLTTLQAYVFGAPMLASMPVDREVGNDRTDNLLANPGNHTNADGWSGYSYTTTSWDPDDRAGDPMSGSLAVRFTGPSSTIYDSYQCIPVDPSIVSYDLRAWGQEVFGQATDGSWNLGYIFYDGANCSGALVNFADDGVWHDQGWEQAEILGATPGAGAVSIRFRLRMVNWGNSGPTDFRFDDVELVPNW